MDLLAGVPALSLALDPVLAQLDQLLDADTLFQRVAADLQRRAPHTAPTGRAPAAAAGARPVGAAGLPRPCGQ